MFPVTTMIAESAHVWNLLVLSYGASSPALSNRERFPTLFRTHPSANMQNPTRVHLFERFKWKRITILQSAEEVFDSTAKDLEEQCREKGIRVERHSFYGDPKDALKAIRRQDARIIVGLFYATEARRVLCQAYHYGLYGHKFVWFMIGWYADTWFIPHPDEGLNCTRKNMEQAVQYHFTTESIMLSRDTLPTISGMTGAQFLKRLRRRIITDPQETGGWPEAPLAYDAVWALALMLNCTMDKLINGKGLQQFNYKNKLIAKRMFECMKNIQFRGVSGQVMFSDLGDRIARTQIEQMQNGKYILLGYYDSSTQTLEWKNKEKFIGSKGPPSDSTRIKQWPIGVDYRLYLVCVNIMVVAIVFCISIFIFNQRYSHRRIIIQSQRQCNNLLIAGSVLSLFSLAPIGFPQDGANDDSIGQIATLGGENKIYSTSPFLFSTFCHLKLLLLMMGFSLAYGSLFAKVWVAHKLGSIQKNRQMTAANNNNEESSDAGACSNIQLNSQQIPPTPWDSIRTLLTAITNKQAIVANALRKISQHSYGNLSSASAGSKSPAPNRRNIAMLQTSLSVNLLNLPIPPSNFYPIIGIICLIDLAVSLFWFLFDPMQQQQIHFPLQEPPIGTELDIMLLPVLDLCQSQYHDVWTAILLSYKGLLLLLGLFLAYDTKHLKVRYLNDLNSALLSVCNVGVLCLLCGTIVVFFLRTQPNPFFCFISITVYVCTFVSIGLIFGPKLLFIYRNPHSTKEEEEEEEQYQKQNTFHESSINQAEQHRYQQLLKENIELKRQIETRNIRIQECRRILENQLVLSSPRVKSNRKFVPQNNNNNNTAAISSSITIEYTSSSCLPTTSSGVGGMGGNGGILLELDQTTISSVIEPTMITILDQQQELSTIEMEQSCDITEEELPLIEDVRRREERSPIVGGGGDTGVCSDYDEDEENYLNKRKPILQNNSSSELLNNKGEDEEEGEEDEEILL
uniref:G-protein coupled receptors family 3 profile domain-containing protein n=1 Tax=Meloidogyne enterolobii TaxID=390850 RepID=A0A6V7X724_MELEN|nr:unnamed protein product [Meloidogyne enterolobii]